MSANDQPSRTTPNPPTLKPLTSRHVAVIGAGAAGLVAARELGREGHKVVVFERGDQVGGTWVYTPKLESDPLGLDPRRSLVHSSMYESLRTNLPREVMGFRDFPFVAREKGHDDGGSELRDPRRFPGHREVLMYLRDFAKEFGIDDEFVRFETVVESVDLIAAERSGTRWRVRSRKRGDFDGVDEVFDAVVVCNGHYSEPRIAEIPGIETWPGKQIHSHSYRFPEPFRDQVVILIGSSASAVDISRDIAGVAKEVHVASRSISDGTIGNQPGYDNIWLHPMIKSTHEDGSVVFLDESIVFADVILHCTGYKYHFPFLETNGIVTVEDNRVGPLYKHVFPPSLAPWLSFVGLPKVIPFPLCELQSMWIAGLLSDRIELPSEEKMMDEINAFYSQLKVSGVPRRYTHQIPVSNQFEYNDWLAEQCGCSVSEEWRKEMCKCVSQRKRTQPESYRDEWDDEEWILQAHHEFKNILQK